jgi:long-subunit acyl-CoA synthetase (AMP-forming)
MPGAQIRLAEGTNEILFYGRHVFMGYLNSATKTRDAFTADNWLCSGE